MSIAYDEFGFDSCREDLAEAEYFLTCILHRKYNNPAADYCGNTVERAEEWCEDNQDEWYIVPLYGYDHGSLSLSLGRPSCPWDSGRLGFVAVRRDIYGEPASDERLDKAIEAHVKDWNHLFSGDVYEYEITSPAGDLVESCGGYLGEWEKSGCLESGRDVLKHLVAEHLEAANMP